MVKQIHEPTSHSFDRQQDSEGCALPWPANLFNLSVDLIFYNTTTSSFAIDYADDGDESDPDLRQYSHAKEGFWSPQIVVALAVTREVLPVKSWVFPGNTLPAASKRM